MDGVEDDLIRDAIWEDDIDLIKQLIFNGKVDINQSDSGGQTPLHLASFWGKVKVIRLLLNEGAQINAKNSAGCTALDLAIHWGHSSAAEIIRLKGGSSIWEERLGKMQIEIENKATQINELEHKIQIQDEKLKKCHADELVAHKEFLAECEKNHLLINSNNFLESENLLANNTIKNLHEEKKLLEEKIDGLVLLSVKLENKNDETAEKLVKAELLRDNATKKFQELVLQQEETVRQWKIAEKVATLADSHRNFSFADRDIAKRLHQEALIELNLLRERLQYTEKELVELQEEAADFLYEKRQNDVRLKRAERALEEVTQDSKAKSVNAAKEYANRIRAEKNCKKMKKKNNELIKEKRLVELKHSHAENALQDFQREFVDTVKLFAESRNVKWENIDREKRIFVKNSGLSIKNANSRCVSTAPNSNTIKIKKDKYMVTEVIDDIKRFRPRTTNCPENSAIETSTNNKYGKAKNNSKQLPILR